MFFFCTFVGEIYIKLLAKMHKMKRNIIFIILPLFVFYGRISANNGNVNPNFQLIYQSQTPSVHITPIDSAEFYSNKIECQRPYPTSKYTKRRKRIRIKCKDKKFLFKDNLSDKFYQEYFIEGIYKNYVFIKAQDYNNELYYMINPDISKIDTLIGYPEIYGDKILCVEGGKTDSKGMIEIWETGGRRLFKISLADYGLYNVEDAFLLNDNIYLKSEPKGFIRIKCDRFRVITNSDPITNGGQANSIYEDK